MGGSPAIHEPIAAHMEPALLGLTGLGVAVLGVGGGVGEVSLVGVGSLCWVPRLCWVPKLCWVPRLITESSGGEGVCHRACLAILT